MSVKKIALGLGFLIVAAQAQAGIALRYNQNAYQYVFINASDEVIANTSIASAGLGLSVNLDGLFGDVLYTMGGGYDGTLLNDGSISISDTNFLSQGEITAVAGIKGGGLSLYGGLKATDRLLFNYQNSGYDITNFRNPVYDGYLVGGGYTFNFGWFMPSFSFNYMWGTATTGVSTVNPLVNTDIELADDANSIYYPNSSYFNGFSGTAKFVWPLWIIAVAPKVEYQSYRAFDYDQNYDEVDLWTESYLGTGVDLILNF
jgi:hypothetical protein